MRCFNGSQCSSYISGVIWLKRGAQQISLAAVCKTGVSKSRNPESGIRNPEPEPELKLRPG